MGDRRDILRVVGHPVRLRNLEEISINISPSLNVSVYATPFKKGWSLK